MPPILLSPLVKWSFIALGGAMVVHWVVKEARRINEELDQAKLTPLLRLKYRDSIADAVADLGHTDEIRKLFSSFQQYLYQPSA